MDIKTDVTVLPSGDIVNLVSGQIIYEKFKTALEFLTNFPHDILFYLLL